MKQLGSKEFTALFALLYFLSWTELGYSKSVASLVGITVLSTGATLLAYAIASTLGWTPPLSETLKKLF